MVEVTEAVDVEEAAVEAEDEVEEDAAAVVVAVEDVEKEAKVEGVNSTHVFQDYLNLILCSTLLPGLYNSQINFYLIIYKTTILSIPR